MLTLRRGNVDIVIASRGIPHIAHEGTLPALPGTTAILGCARVIADVPRDPIFSRHPLAGDGTRWLWAVLVPVHLAGMPSCVVLTCGDPRRGIDRPPDLLERLHRMAAVIADEIELIGEINELTRAARLSGLTHCTEDLPLPLFNQFSEVEQSIIPGESPGVVTEFLLSTLVPQRRMLRRGEIPYHALAKWRASLKAWQIAALRALKRDPPQALVDRIADDLADAARAFWGTGTYRAVVPVPCGNSGPGCLAERLAEATALRLTVPMIAAFEPIAVKGSSHPRRNARRPAMVLAEAPKVPVLLIDDVATSGRHIEEAALILRRTAPAVLPLVWIAN